MHLKSAVALSAWLALTVPAIAQEVSAATRERFTASAIAMGTTNPPVIPRGRSTTLEIEITRWSTDEEHQALFDILAERGQSELVRALQAQPETGFVRVTGTGSTRMPFPIERLRYARQLDLGDGMRRIVLGFDRPISLWEAWTRPRWRDFDVTLIFMDVNKKGNGEGQLAMGARLSADAETGTLVVESFGTEPVRLTRIRGRR